MIASCADRHDRHMDRRCFLSSAGAALVTVGSAGALAACRPEPAPTPSPGGGRRVLGEGDLRLVGSFVLPGDVEGGDLGWGTGLTQRQVGGRTHLLAAMVDGRVVELAAPEPGAFGDDMAAAEPVRVWGDVTGETRVLDGGDGRGSQLMGLYWDDEGQRLWWTFADPYNTISGQDPSVGWSRLGDDGRVGPEGAWRLPDPGCKQTQGGVLALPRWFSERYCPGRTMAAGFGGYFSIATVGPISAGPSLHAFDPAAMTAATHLGSVDSTALVAYPFTSNPPAPPDRCHRDSDYRTEFDGWHARGGTGYWTWSDTLWQSGAWIDLPDVHGFVVFPTMGNGRVWYESSDLHAERGAHWAMVYDPDDLGRVATGAAKRWEIQPTHQWRMHHPGMEPTLAGWSGVPSHVVIGTSFDPATRRLMVALRHGAQRSADTFPVSAVHVYEVA